MHPAIIEDRDHIRKFLVAGKATFTLVSKKTGKRFTYCVQLNKEGTVAFVSLMRKRDCFSYIGIIPFSDGVPQFGSYHATKGSQAKEDAPSQVALKWFLSRVDDDKDVSQVELWHAGRCGRCCKELTDPESISRGLGPVCAGKA